MSRNGLVPAARSPHDSGMTMYENARARAAATVITSVAVSETPVYDTLVTEYRTGFRSVPGDPWSEHPVPRFTELGGSGDRHSLPGPTSGF